MGVASRRPHGLWNRGSVRFRRQDKWQPHSPRPEGVRAPRPAWASRFGLSGVRRGRLEDLRLARRRSASPLCLGQPASATGQTGGIRALRVPSSGAPHKLLQEEMSRHRPPAMAENEAAGLSARRVDRRHVLRGPWSQSVCRVQARPQPGEKSTRVPTPAKTPPGGWRILRRVSAARPERLPAEAAGHVGPRIAVAQRPSPTRPPHLAMAGKEGRRGAAPRPPGFAVGEVTGRGFPSCSGAGRPGQLCRGDGCRCRPGARLPTVPSTRSSLGEFPAAGASLFTSVRLARRTESCRSRCTFR